MLYDTDKNHTIAAVSTAPGKSGIAVVKVSGGDSIRIAKSIFTGSKDPEHLNRVMVYGHIVDNGVSIDEVLICYMKSPHSYTGEDVVEIQCHGGYAAARTILKKLIEHGAVPAEPGEFTKRAFLNGRIDLIQAESVMEIVSAEGREHLRRAERLMEGAFSKRIDLLLEDLKYNLSLLEVNIDFHHHVTDTIQKDNLRDSLTNIIFTLDTMIASYRTSQRIKDGLRVVLAGKVNSGKSSLFNALLGRKRAIVTSIPGTTRDWLEERIELDGISINLIDTAGLRKNADDIELEGVRESERFLRDADIIVYLIEAYDTGSLALCQIENKENVIHLLSKSDLLPDKPYNSESIAVSSKTGDGLDELTGALEQMARPLIENFDSDSLVMIERHKRELEKSRDSVKRAIDSIDSWSEEVTVLELNEALRHIEAILGRNIDLDVLDSIFKQFCIGK